MSTIVRFNEVCIMFGPAPARALDMADEGATREDIQAATTRSSASTTARWRWRRARSSS
jgi:ABC-type proline/glycine betaine transport system ATPase subunit